MSRRFLRQTVSLGVSYTLGTFNDNFFKQGILLLAVSMGHTAVQAWGTVLFSLPFVLFSAWAGWLADRYPKCRLVLAAKALEVCAMLAGGWGLLQLHWSGMLAMLFCMGASATLFSPALNGSLPELFAREDVPRVNALFKLATTASILLGITLAGGALERQWLATEIPFGRWLVAAVRSSRWPGSKAAPCPGSCPGRRPSCSPRARRRHPRACRSAMTTSWPTAGTWRPSWP